MNALDYARKYIWFWKDSPIYGPFDDIKYPFLRDPLLELSNIRVKDLCVWGAAQTVKTILKQIATAYALDVMRCSVLAVAQTDDDAKEDAKMKLNPFLKRIKSLADTAISAQTLNGWMWAANELIVSGPGQNAQNSKSVRRVHTDEAHLFPPGAMVALGGRMGLRWDRQQLDTTTAPDAGSECDIRWHKGRQNEWNLGCIHCDRLFMPLWIEKSRERYNGHQVFQWTESQSETEMLDSIRMYCPHCDKEIEDLRFNREGLNERAGYVAMKPDADKAWNSFRWNVFAPRWLAWREIFEIYLTAIASAKMGELEPYRDWVTKREVETWTGQYPMLGDSTRGRNYKLADVKIEVVEPSHLRFCSADQQESGGFHLKVEISEWDKNGNSKRLLYDNHCPTFADMEQAKQRYGVANLDGGPDRKGPKAITTAIDYGQGMRQREIFAACARFKWLAMKSDDKTEFAHIIQQPGQLTKTIAMPYSEPQMQSALVGTKAQSNSFRGKGVPDGFCLSCQWSKPTIYGIFYALKNGETEREFGVASDITKHYVDQLHSYTPQLLKDAKTNIPKPILWVKTAPEDHSWITSCQSLVLAIMAGYFPMSKRIETTLQPT